MAIPFKPTGIGQVAAKNVFRINFSEALSAIPELHAWDDFNLDSIANKVFTGTTVNSDLPMIGAIGVSSAPSASWYTSSLVAGAAEGAASLLKGNTGYCLLDTTAPIADGEVFFNFDFKFPSDVLPSDTMSFALSLLYNFTGATPTVTWFANEGTEGTPVWTALTDQPKDSAGAATVIRPSDTGGTGVGDTVTIPSSGEAFPNEIFVTVAA